MRLITSLSLSAAVLAIAGAPLYAQTAPAVAPFTAAPAATAAPRAAAAAAPAPAAAAAPTAVASAETKPSINSSRITATVNETSISDYEVEQRLNFFIAVNANGAKLPPDEMKRLRAQTLQDLEDEKIQIAEARRRKVNVSPVDVDERVDEFLKENNSTMEQLQAALTAAGSSIKTMRDRYTASIAWMRVLQQEFSSEVVVTPEQKADALRRALEGADKPHYRVAEIFLAVDRPEDDAKVKAQLEEIEKQVRNNGSFRLLARQFSRNPSAALGGDMGWVYDGQLEPELNKTLAAMKIGEVSHPVRGRAGWYLLGLPDRQEPIGTVVTVEAPAPSGPPGTLPLARLLLPLPPGAARDAVENTMKYAVQIRSMADTCETLEKISQDKILSGSVYTRLGDFKVSDLNPELQKVLAETKPGETAAPVVLDAGVEIFMRCDKRAAPPRAVFKAPTLDEIENRLFQEQISAMARRYMRDLKRSANIAREQDSAVVDAALVK
jgi:peptidyl-prolyl cis-trans isomerase SurA